MTLPDADDALLFGSLALASLGAALVAFSVTDRPLLGVGVALVLFGIPATLIAFMAASEPDQ